MNQPKLKYEEKSYCFVCYREFRYGFEIKIEPYGEIVVNRKSKKYALKQAREIFSDVIICRVELKSMKIKTWVLSQKDDVIQKLIKEKGELTESEVYL